MVVKLGTTVGNMARYGYAVAQGMMGLFAAGAVLAGAHKLFLRYYANEWRGVQISGVNGCVGEDMIANADLIGGKTFCNKPENFVPWVEVYRHHPRAAALYYGVAVTVILIIGLLAVVAQRRIGATTPFGGSAKPAAPADHEHLR
jgi:hypothetical protein